LKSPLIVVVIGTVLEATVLMETKEPQSGMLTIQKVHLH